MNLKSLWHRFKEAFHNPKHYLLIAVHVTQKLKEAVESDLITTVVKLTPSHVDDILLAKIKVILTEALYALRLCQKGIGNEALLKAQMKLSAMAVAERGSYWKSLAGHLYSGLSGVDLEPSIAKCADFYHGQYVMILDREQNK